MMTPDTLDLLDPPTHLVPFRGESLHIRPLTIGQLPQFVRLTRPLLDALLDVPLDTLPQADAALLDALLTLIAEHGDAVIAAAALLTDKPIEWIQAGDPAEFITLVQAIFAVNRDFFTHRLTAQRGTPVPLANGTGPIPSNTSLSTATQ
ncbi:hypothetical protein XFUD_02190 [Xylella fastidiosa]|uniref:Uncharacterized protein n=1 Tax=Xylella fastidiosa (strain 9a5c) TaxID=160492 RepID=Q9PFY7_XYLFA|nr:DUF6631 family protein [Xylella fastidiosa]AAF83329.1 hypothetical protein XF_0519 [Xylella fastidiosa 9a5c]ALQ94156.1 hypothetical protein XFUD_02190 [Xylella fastidiosa]